jgi:hypothetical protein
MRGTSRPHRLTDSVDGDEGEERLEAVHPLQHPPKPLNLRLQPLHHGAVAAPAGGSARWGGWSAQSTHAVQSDNIRRH